MHSGWKHMDTIVDTIQCKYMLSLGNCSSLMGSYRVSLLCELLRHLHEKKLLWNLSDSCLILAPLQAWNTLRARETVALGRELLGGNGILSDFLVAKVSSYAFWLIIVSRCLWENLKSTFFNWFFTVMVKVLSERRCLSNHLWCAIMFL